MGIVAVLYLSLIGKNPLLRQNPPGRFPVTTITNVPTPENSLYIVKADPPDDSENVDPQKPISLVFNRKLARDEIRFALNPEASYSVVLKDNVFTVAPKDGWAEGEHYTYAVGFNVGGSLTVSYTFTVSGAVKPPPDTYSDIPAKAEEDWTKKDRPDVFLYNKTPFENDDFMIKGFLKTSPKEQFYFLVNFKTGNTSGNQQKTLMWIKSQGLTDDQIKTIEILYGDANQNPD